jgi:hypothetical protein
MSNNRTTMTGPIKSPKWQLELLREAIAAIAVLAAVYLGALLVVNLGRFWP